MGGDYKGDGGERVPQKNLLGGGRQRKRHPQQLLLLVNKN